MTGDPAPGGPGDREDPQGTRPAARPDRGPGAADPSPDLTRGPETAPETLRPSRAYRVGPQKSAI